jgi:hypothetical protein
MKKVMCVFLALFSVFLSNPLPAAALEETDYLAILVDGHKVGYSTHTRKVDDKKVTTTENMNMLIGRGDMAIRYVSKETSVESLAGKPISFEMTQNISGNKETRKGSIKDGRFKMTVQKGSEIQTTENDYPAEIGRAHV